MRFGFHGIDAGRAVEVCGLGGLALLKSILKSMKACMAMVLVESSRPTTC